MVKTTSKRSTFLILSDACAIAIMYWIGFNLRFHAGIFQITGIPFFYLSEMVFLLLFYIFDLYYPFKVFKPAQTLTDIILSVVIGSTILAATSYADRSFIAARLTFIYMMISLIPTCLGIRLLYDFIFQSRLLDKKTVVIGTGSLALEIARVIKETPYSGIEVMGFVQENKEDKKNSPRQTNGNPILGSLSNLLSLMDWYKIQFAVLALDPKHDVSETSLMSDILKRGIAVTSAISLFETLQGEIPYQVVDSHYLLGLMSQVKSRPYLKLKRFMDMLAASVLLVLLSPLLLIIVLILKLTDQSPIFFIQERIGMDSKPFHLVKFRTMTAMKRGKPRVTSIGRWIRRYRIDEIPQLINVLKGDMSLIGPRPEIPYFVSRSRKRIPFYDAVFTVKPGLTGWAQVKFRHVTSIKDYDRKFRYNLFYLKNVSLALDLMILLKTIRVVILGDGR